MYNSVYSIFSVSHRAESQKWVILLVPDVPNIAMCCTFFSLEFYATKVSGGGWSLGRCMTVAGGGRHLQLGHCSLQGHWPRSPPASLTSPTQECSLTFWWKNHLPGVLSLLHPSLRSRPSHLPFSPAGELQMRWRAILAPDSPGPTNWFWEERAPNSHFC